MLLGDFINLVVFQSAEVAANDPMFVQVPVSNVDVGLTHACAGFVEDCPSVIATHLLIGSQNTNLAPPAVPEIPISFSVEMF